MDDEQPQTPDRTVDDRTGDEVVDAALAELGGLDADLPLEEHVRVLDGVHQALHQRLVATQA